MDPTTLSLIVMRRGHGIGGSSRLPRRATLRVVRDWNPELLQVFMLLVGAPAVLSCWLKMSVCFGVTSLITLVQVFAILTC